MLQERERSVRVVLLGLPLEIAETLNHIVSQWGAVLYIPPLFPILQSLGLIEDAGADLVFVWTGAEVGPSLLDLVRKAQPQIPAVAVNFHTKSTEALDALDSGAIDYCTPPFDLTHIQWLLQGARHGQYSC